MVMNREINYEVSQSKNRVRTWWLRQGLHDTPGILKNTLQDMIDRVEDYQQTLDEDKQFDYICLGYGLCSNGILGIMSRTIPVIVPRCDDCISLFLGSADQYRSLFRKYPGAYWYNTGWIEQAFTPSKQSYERHRHKYLQQYDEETVTYLMEKEMEWTAKYNYGVYIQSPVYDCAENESYAQEASQLFGWKYQKESGTRLFFYTLVNGPWKEADFLVCPPGHKICPDYSTAKIKAVYVQNLHKKQNL